MKKAVGLLVVLALALAPIQIGWAAEGDAGSSTGKAALHSVYSALIPGLGQIMNKDQKTTSGKVKIGVMWFIEIAAIITTPILFCTVGWPVAVIGISLFGANALWSAIDAYVGAKRCGASTTGTTVR